MGYKVTIKLELLNISCPPKKIDAGEVPYAC